MRKVIIDKNKCIGCLECVRTCPSVFEIGDDGYPQVRKYITNGDIEEAESSVINCIGNAISIGNETSDSILGSIWNWANDEKE